MSIDFSTAKDYLAIIDFEATCDERGFPRKESEIIEFAGVIIDKQLTIVERFSKFIKPIFHPILTPFCTELTSIRQVDVDGAKGFPDVLTDFMSLITMYDPLFASWGRYDKFQLLQDC